MSLDSIPVDAIGSRHATSELTGKTIAITGASGFIGGRMLDRLTPLDCKILRVSRAELNEPAVRDHIVDADVIFHLGAQTSTAVAAKNPPADFAANVAPLRNLLATCRQRRRRPIVIFAGTVTQAGLAAQLPVNEDAADNPVTVYDRHKLIAEQDLEQAAADGTVRGVCLRLANVYGPGGHGRNPDRDVLNRMIRAALRGESLTVYGTGEFVRDYVFIDDAVNAFLMAATRCDAANGRHFVIGSGQGCTIRAAFELVASRVYARTGRRVPVIDIEPAAPLSAIERRNFIADASAFSAATGWRAEYSLRDGIDRTIEACLCA
jgi:UDP-glucose 4-epimerase